MRTVTVTNKYEVYKFNELSNNAKEVVKRWYLDGQDSSVYTDMCMEDLGALFGYDNNLEVEYSLGYCQGDGFNIYGEINAEDIFNCLENHNGGTQLEKFENVLTDKEKRTILCYQKECKDIKLPHNFRYGYCMADYIDIVDDWSYDLEYCSEFENINYEVLKKFEDMVKDIFSTLCNSYEKGGYEYFYEIDEADLEEFCEANEYEFLADGTLF